MRKSTTGFTIVELLIVIVVIGILATITIVAYNGVQQRAKNTVTINAASGWLKLLSMSYTVNGKVTISDLPSGATGLCMGNPADLPATSKLGAGECYNNLFANQQFYDAVKAVGDAHMKPAEFDTGDGNYTRGIQFSEGYLLYDLVGSGQDCKLPSSVADNGMSSSNETVCKIGLNNAIGGLPVGW